MTVYHSRNFCTVLGTLDDRGGLSHDWHVFANIVVSLRGTNLSVTQCTYR